MSTLKVGGIRGVSASSDAITVANDGTCTANVTNRSNKNIIINGDMRVAQRGTSSTSNGYQTIDRYKPYEANTGATPTYSQVDVTSGGAYDAGFRKALQITKGVGTTNANSQVNVTYKIEAQDIANSGWKYKDPNSKITISFWLKTSVSNHNPQLLVIDDDSGTTGTKYYQVDIPTLTADTWTKVTATIPGHADQVYNNDNGTGMEFQIIPWYGTDFTDAGNTMNAWTSFGTKPVNATWLTTNNSTFQITGIQLEVGDHATDFEHRSYAQERTLCERYFEILEVVRYSFCGSNHGTGSPYIKIYWNTRKRAQATITLPTIGQGTDELQFVGANGSYMTGSTTVALYHINDLAGSIQGSSYSGNATGSEPCMLYGTGTARIQVSAEL